MPTCLGACHSILREIAWVSPSAFVIVWCQSLLHEALLILTLEIVSLFILRGRKASFYAGAWSSSSFGSGAIHVVLDVVSNCVWLSLLSQVFHFHFGLVQTTKIGCWIHQLRNFDMVVCYVKGATLIIVKSDIIWNWNFNHLFAFNWILSCVWNERTQFNGFIRWTYFHVISRENPFSSANRAHISGYWIGDISFPEGVQHLRLVITSTISLRSL